MIEFEKIINKSEEEVKEVLGELSKSIPGRWRYYGEVNYSHKPSPLNCYKEGLIEIKFIENKSVRITIYDYKKEDLKEILKIKGLYKIMYFSGESTTRRYIYIITDERYK